MLKKRITLVRWANERAILHYGPVLVLGIQQYILEGNGCPRLLGLPCRSRITTPWMIWRSQVWRSILFSLETLAKILS